MGPPHVLIAARSFSGVESTNLLRISGRISVHQTFRIIVQRSSRLEERRSETVFEYTPRSFQWIQVWAVTRLLQKMYRVVLQPPGGCAAPMAWGSIMQEDGATRGANVCH